MKLNSISVSAVLITIHFMICTNVFAIEIDKICPRMIHRVFASHAPIGNKTAGDYKEFAKTKLDLHGCVLECCAQTINCNVAFVFNQTCYHVKCVSNELCLPLKRPNVNNNQLMMVLVNPTTAETSWLDVLKENNVDAEIKSNDLNPSDIKLNDILYRQRLPFTYPNNILDEGYRFENEAEPDPQYDGDLLMDESKISINREANRCLLDDTEKMCQENEECVPLANARFGICNCKFGFKLNKQFECVSVDSDAIQNAEQFTEKWMKIKALNNENKENKMDVSEESSQQTGKLSVRVVSKTVQLPEKTVILAAFPVPDEQTSEVPYNYTWQLLSQPSGDGNGSMSDKTKSEIHLSNLSEGIYRFKIDVSGKGWHGETFANVTVLPERRINKAPMVQITPAQQIIKEPTSMAILDGSTSKDDDQIKSWHWDLIQGPIGYQPTLPETSTLQLTSLSLPGNYTFKLTVTDSDNVSNSTTARISVLKATDYPPIANAGHDEMIYLPQNSVTLNGSLSTDDHEITAWEWTKASTDVSKAVDMQNTRTPYLQLSNLEVGIYTFVLKVTDASNQSNTDDMLVFVKPPRSDRPPAVNAGQNATINLPQTWAVLNATNSTDDIKIRSYQWSQLSGPNSANIINKNAVVANATGLVVGTYTFEVFVIDESNNNASSKVIISIVQERNTAPVAHAGGDQTVILPTNCIYMNGSKSEDDLGIISYEWIRDSSSLAIGTIVGKTDHEPVLIITNIVPGRYVFKLTVSDSQGLTGIDTVSVIVRPDPLLINLVEVTFTVGVTALTQSEALSLQQKLALLLGNEIKLRVRDLRMEQKTGEAILIFYAENTFFSGSKDNEIMVGIDVERLLKEKLWKGSNIVGTPISDIRSTICQNKCSGHGSCNSESRACMCEPFWMPSIYYFWGFSEANCDWSILYAVIGVFVIFMLISTVCWVITCYCRRTPKPRLRAKAQKYALLESHENEVPTLNRGTSLSESETDSDVLFENNKKSNDTHRSNNGIIKNGQSLYTTTRLGRRIKT